jgi:PAS domain S-box-containing protein
MSENRKNLRFLIVEDNLDDAFLLMHAMKSSFPESEFVHVQGKAELVNYLATMTSNPAIVLSDWSLPQFNGLAALDLVREKGLDAPFIIVSGKIGEEAAIQAIKKGVFDYVLKDNMGRLPSSIEHALAAYESEKRAKIDNALIALQATALGVAPVAIVVVDPQGFVEWVNPAFESLTGYGANDVLGLAFGSISSGMEREAFEHSEALSISIEKRKNGSLYYEERKICPVVEHDGSVSHFVVIKKDVTQSEQEKRELALEVEFSDVLRSAKTMEGLSQQVVGVLGNQFPEAKAGVCLLSKGETRAERWYGTRPAKSLSPGKLRHFRRELGAQEERIGYLVFQYPVSTPLDIDRILADFCARLESTLQKMLAQKKIATQLGHISFLKLIGSTITSILDFESIATPLLERIREILDCDATALYLIEKDSNTLVCHARCNFRSGMTQRIAIDPGEKYVGIAAEEQRIVSVSEFEDLDHQGQFYKLIKLEEFSSQHCAPIIVGNKTIGVLEVFQRKLFTPSSEWLILFDAIATQTGLALDYNTIFADLQRTFIDLKLSYEATIDGWSRAMDFRDQETEGHSRRVTTLTATLALKMGLTGEKIDEINRGALLHDIGKIGIPDSILKKAGPLDEEEWKLMKRHPRIAYQMLERIPYLKNSLNIPLYHHEKWDGSGYPEGLRGEAIPIEARLFSIVDVFDALTSDRPYRDAWSVEKTVAYIREQSGKQFDPKIVDEFLGLLELPSLKGML